MVKQKVNSLQKRPIKKPYYQYLGEIVELQGPNRYAIKWHFLHPPNEKKGEISKNSYWYTFFISS